MFKAEFLVFSDAHFHDLSFQAEENDSFDGMTGLNSRLMDCARQFMHMVKYAGQHGIRYILFCGDLYHSKKMVSKDVTNVLFGLFQWAADNYAINFVMIPGNHDYVDKAGTNHSLLPFRCLPTVAVLDKPKDDYVIYPDKGGVLVLRGIPYVEDKEKLIEAMNAPSVWVQDDTEDGLDGPIWRVLLSHSGMQGAKVGTDFVMVKDHDLSVSDVPATRYDLCLFGHFHEHQRVFDNGWIVGATHQMNWSDANGKRGFIHVTIDQYKNVEVLHIPTVETVPRFHDLENGHDFAGVRPIDFVKYRVDEPLSEDLVERTKGFIAATIGDVPKFLELIPPNVKLETAEMSEQAISADTVIDEWVNTKGDDLDKAALARIGKELLLAARQKLE